MAREWNGEESTKSPAELEAELADKRKKDKRDLDDSILI